MDKPDRGSIEKRHRMDKPVIQAVLRQDTNWTNQRHRQYWDETHNGQTRVTSSIGIRQRMDKSETQAALKQDREWTNQRHRQY
jgi:hypothetical protein